MAFEQEDLERKLNMLADDSRSMADSLVNFQNGFNKLEKQFNKLETALMGNEQLGIKPIFDRIFDKITEVNQMVISNEKRITNIERLIAIDDGVDNERRRIFNFVANYIFPTSMFAGLLAVGWKFLCWVFK